MPLDTKAPVRDEPFRQVGTRPVRPDGVDKVTGRAKFGADLKLPGMLIGRVLRSPHPHARIRTIDTSKAEALEGVKAVVTRADFPDIKSGEIVHGEADESLHDIVMNVMARDKALYEGHAVAAVAATSAMVARKALALIEVDYEPLPHVTDVDAAMQPDAPILHEDMFTSGMEPKPETPSNIARTMEVTLGEVAEGFAEADVVVERDFKTEAAHQGYIEPQACLASVAEDGQAELWCCTQGHYFVRNACAKILGIEISKLRVTASEIGGGFGGKTTVFVEPVALALSRKAGRPVRLVMSRDEVFRATGPTSSTSMWVKMGVTKDGRITAGEAVLRYQGGAFSGSPVEWGAMSAFACYDLAHVKVHGFDVVANRPKAAAYRAPGSPMSAFAVESVVDEPTSWPRRSPWIPSSCASRTPPGRAPRPPMGPPSGPTAWLRPCRPPRCTTTIGRPLAPSRVAGWPAASGSTSAVRLACRSTWPRTGPSPFPSERRTLAAPAPPSARSRPRSWAFPTTR
jgi:CO/xanthine dehydrogenase Mo-binding subunit